jgi:hypothetical protein
VIIWLNKQGFFNRVNPFLPIVQRQVFERQEYWKEVGGLRTKTMDRPTLTEIFLKAQQEHPEVPEFQPMLHNMSVVGAATEATLVYLETLQQVLADI